jgi:hypothetical protein
MKTHLVVLLFANVVAFSVETLGQSDLQFNQVYSYAGYLSQGGQTEQWIVPVGKVWKVEHFSHAWFVVNGGRANVSETNNGPLWLKAGDAIMYSGPIHGACCGGSINFLISIVEFNLIPID